jgi:hypothetical protein
VTQERIVPKVLAARIHFQRASLLALLSRRRATRLIYRSAEIYFYLAGCNHFLSTDERARSPAAWTPASSTLPKMTQEARWMFDFPTAQSAPSAGTAQASLSSPFRYFTILINRLTDCSPGLSPLPIGSVSVVVHPKTTRSIAIHITTKLAVLLLSLVHITSVE